MRLIGNLVKAKADPIILLPQDFAVPTLLAVMSDVYPILRDEEEEYVSDLANILYNLRESLVFSTFKSGLRNHVQRN